MTIEAFLWIYDDSSRGLALLRGRNVKSVLRSACALDVARWSVSGKGWVVPGDRIADVCAMADYEGVPYRVKAVES